MSDESNDVAKPDESLAAAIPDPAAPPKLVASNDGVLRGLIVVGVVLVAVGGLLLPLFVESTRGTPGATRSARIQQEQREAEIHRAMADYQAPSAADDEHGNRQAGDGDLGGR